MINPTPTPIFSGQSPQQVSDDISHLVDFQPEGMPLDELDSLISKYLKPHLLRYDLPQFQSMFNAFPPPEAKLGGHIGLAYNQGVTNWQVSPGGAVLEELCCEALCKLFGLSPNAEATFMYSGTYGNLQGLYMALHRHAERQGFNLATKGLSGFKDLSRLAILVSKEAHFSLKHAVRTLGLGEDSLVTLPIDEKRRIKTTQLKKYISELQKTHDIFCVVATAGTTNVGAIDPIAALAEICTEIGAWLHVDGAYGYAYKLVPEWKHRFEGDERADSIVWDPHKQLGAPIPNSILFTNNKNEFSRMALHSVYFNRVTDIEPNPGIKSPPSTRPLSALPLMAILRGQGIQTVIDNLRTPLIAIQKLADKLNAAADIEVMVQPETGIICFRMSPPGIQPDQINLLQQELYDQIMLTGRRTISTTKLDGNTVLRLVTVSSDIRFEDLYATIEDLRTLIR